MASHQQNVHGFHGDFNKPERSQVVISLTRSQAVFPIYSLVSLPVDVLRRPLVEVLANPVQFFRGAQRVERQFLHITLDQTIFGIHREDVVH